jgi:SAM-dependent methyltransferase
VVAGIPDFVLGDLELEPSPVLQGVEKIDRLAGIYETWLWYPLVMAIYGGLGSPSINEMTERIAGCLVGIEGEILDAACGPGTYGRRLASPSRAVYGVDVSMGMLRRGMRYVAKEPLRPMHLARAQVELLPFEDARFDGVLCCGALHLFSDTVAALQEIGRTMKPGAPLAVFTFFGGDRGVLQHRWVREHVRADHGIHIFEVGELEVMTQQAGFTSHQQWTRGSVLVFSVWRGA